MSASQELCLHYYSLQFKYGRIVLCDAEVIINHALYFRTAFLRRNLSYYFMNKSVRHCHPVETDKNIIEKVKVERSCACPCHERIKGSMDIAPPIFNLDDWST
jgi:hypothetical protein